jgi:hypothetical protein
VRSGRRKSRRDLSGKREGRKTLHELPAGKVKGRDSDLCRHQEVFYSTAGAVRADIRRVASAEKVVQLHPGTDDNPINKFPLGLGAKDGTVPNVA